jgi:hypothetical protein
MSDTDWPPSRLAGAKEAAVAYCQRLSHESPQACVAVVAYGDSAVVHRRLTAAHRLNALTAAINRIEYLGSTNIHDGLEAAHSILRRHRRSMCQVVLLSDGHNTGGNPNKVAASLKRLAVIETVGIGGSPRDVDEKLLCAIASENPDGSKRYRWIGDKQRLVQHFHELAGRIRRA